jgi:hypothetical protein
VTLLAAAKMGIKVIDIDPAVNTVASVREALKLASCKAIFFDPVVQDVDYLKLLRKSIPEFFYYDDEYGEQFHSKYFPELKLFVQTGMDVECGCINYKNIFLKNPAVNMSDAVASALKDDTPAYTSVTAENGKVVAGRTLTHGQLLSSGLPSWQFAQRIINKEYFEI